MPKHNRGLVVFDTRPVKSDQSLAQALHLDSRRLRGRASLNWLAWQNRGVLPLDEPIL